MSGYSPKRNRAQRFFFQGKGLALQIGFLHCKQLMEIVFFKMKHKNAAHVLLLVVFVCERKEQRV